MPSLLSVAGRAAVVSLEAGADTSTPPVLHLEVTAMSALFAVVSTLSGFLGPYIPDILLQLCHPNRTDDAPANVAVEHASAARAALAEKVPARILFPAVIGAYQSAMVKPSAAALVSAVQLLRVLSTGIRCEMRGGKFR